MKDFIQIQYRFKVITKEKVKSYVHKWITADEYKEITGEDYTTEG